MGVGRDVQDCFVWGVGFFDHTRNADKFMFSIQFTKPCLLAKFTEGRKFIGLISNKISWVEYSLPNRVLVMP